MKRIYTLLLAVAFVGFAGIAGAQVLIDTDFSDMDPVPANRTNILDGPIAITNGTIYWFGCRYNDTGSLPRIGDDSLDPNSDPELRYIRTGTNGAIGDDGKPTTHFFQVTPTEPFVNGGMVTLLVSSNGDADGILVYDATDGGLLGEINLTGMPRYTISSYEFTLPETFSGVKALAFIRKSITYFTWGIKVETNGEGVSIKDQVIKPVTYSSNKTITVVDSFGKNVEVYSLTGTKIYGQVASSSRVVVPAPAGVYLVVVNNVSTKVIVK